MKRLTLPLLALALAPAPALCVLPTQAEESTSTWQPPYVGSRTDVLYLPDANAVYWRYGSTRTPGDTSGFVVKGEFPNARYFSYNVYDDDTKSSLGSFTDFQLIPDEGENPFAKGVESSGSYTIHILPEGVESDAKNILRFPDSVVNVSFFLRNYLAEGGIEGGVPMPTIAIYDPATGETSPAPPSSNVPSLSLKEAEKYLMPLMEKLVTEFKEQPEAVMAKLQHRDRSEPFDMKELICRQIANGVLALFDREGVIESYNVDPGGTYPNKDNLYLALPVVRTEGEALLVQFRAPEFASSPVEYPSSDLRYFSLSQGDENTFNYTTTIDRDMLVSEDGMIRFIIGDDTPALREKAEALGVNFQPWLVEEKLILVYRHMLPAEGFEFGINNVPTFSKEKPKAGQEGRASISDYAPVGKLVPAQEFLDAEEFPKF